MATGRADFWYGRPFIVTDTPNDGNSEDAPTANWAYNHAVNPSAHHVRYNDAEAVLAMGATEDTNTLRHNRYSGGEAQEAMGVKANYNPFHHDRYADSEAVAAMGAKANSNPLNHDRFSYTDAEAQAACWPVFLDRGDPSAEDYVVGDFTKDGTWRDLNLTGKLPAGSKAALLWVYVQADAANRNFAVRKNGNLNAICVNSIITQVANQPFSIIMMVGVDANLTIEYNADNVSWTYIFLRVLGGIR